MASAAVAAIGTLIKIGDGAGSETFTTIAEVKDITGPSETVDTIEVTSQDSTGNTKEYIASLKDGGEVSFPMNFVSSAAQTAIHTDMQNRTRRNFKIVTTHASPVTMTFAAFITQMGHTFQVADVAMRNVTLKITGR
jgi:predicted secreted protein